MSDPEITALAREYAEYACPIEVYEELIPLDKDDAIERKSDMLAVEMQVEQIFEWLLRRFCLVEKSKIEEEYHEAKFTCGNVDPCSDTFVSSLAQKSVLERLFPEIEKEVEG